MVRYLAMTSPAEAAWRPASRGEIAIFVGIGALAALCALLVASQRTWIAHPALRGLTSFVAFGFALGSFSGAVRLARKRRHDMVDPARVELERFCPACGRDSEFSRPFCMHCAFPSDQRRASWIEEGADERGGLFAYLFGLGLTAGGWAIMGFVGAAGVPSWLAGLGGFVIGALGLFMVGSMLVQFVTSLRARRSFMFKGAAGSEGTRFDVKGKARFVGPTLLDASGISQAFGVSLLAIGKMSEEELAAVSPQARLFARVMEVLFRSGQLNLYPARVQRWTRSGPGPTLTLDSQRTLDVQVLRDQIPPATLIEAVATIWPWLPAAAFERSSVASLWAGVREREDADFILRRFLSQASAAPKSDFDTAVEVALLRSIGEQSRTEGPYRLHEHRSRPS